MDVQNPSLVPVLALLSIMLLYFLWCVFKKNEMIKAIKGIIRLLIAIGLLNGGDGLSIQT